MAERERSSAGPARNIRRSASPAGVLIAAHTAPAASQGLRNNE